MIDTQETKEAVVRQLGYSEAIPLSTFANLKTSAEYDIFFKAMVFRFTAEVVAKDNTTDTKIENVEHVSYYRWPKGLWAFALWKTLLVVQALALYMNMHALNALLIPHTNVDTSFLFTNIKESVNVPTTVNHITTRICPHIDSRGGSDCLNFVFSIPKYECTNA